MKKHLLLILLFLSFVLNAIAQNFTAIDSTKFTQKPILAPYPLRYDILFIGGYDGVTNANGEVSVAKVDNDFTGYVPIEGRSDSGYVIINHESIQRNITQGDGGGMTVFTAFKDKNSGKWAVANDPKGKFRAVDFTNVGGTFANCGGFQTPWGTVITAEEWMYDNNNEIFDGGKGIGDTSDYIVNFHNGKNIHQTIKRYENYDWMVEVNPETGKAVQKLYNMGRYGHEGGIMINDSTVFLTDDSSPGYIYLFKTERPRDLSEGQLYVYQQSSDGNNGKWLPMPMDLNSLIRSHDISAMLGATIFNRTEWAVLYQDNILFTETGKDKTDFNEAVQKGAKLSKHLSALDSQDGNMDNKVNDYYGRILSLNIHTLALTTFIEGGQADKSNIHLANPDCLALSSQQGNTYMVIHEDLNGYSFNRVPAGVNTRINEIFWLDMQTPNPTKNDLKRFFIGPDGCETTGGRFTPDGLTYFFNIQHPMASNPFPYNHPITVAVSGFEEHYKNHVNITSTNDKNIIPQLDVNQQFIEIKLSKGKYVNLPSISNIVIYNDKGLKVKDYSKITKVDISQLPKGKYFVEVNQNQLFIVNR
jgi:secreted PhoX family phosphatase